MRNLTKTTIFHQLFIILTILKLINGISNIKNGVPKVTDAILASDRKTNSETKSPQPLFDQKQEEKKEKEELKFDEKFIKGLSVSLKIQESIKIIRDRKTGRFKSDNDERLGLEEKEKEEEEKVTEFIMNDRRMQELEKEKEYLVVNRTVELLEGKKNLKGITERSSAAVVLFGREVPKEILNRILEIGSKDNNSENDRKYSVRRLNNLGDADNGNNEILREEYRYGYKGFDKSAKSLAISNKLFDEGIVKFPKENRNAVYLQSDYDENPDDKRISDEGLTDVLERIFFEKIFEIDKNSEEINNEKPDELIKELDFDNNNNNYSNDGDGEDICKKWLRSENKLKETFLGDLRLPSCPCDYPSQIFYDDQIFDKFNMKNYRWRDVSGENERLNVYKPGATYCIRSLLNQRGGTASAQHCCYDVKRRLITRGSGAGTPNLISPEVSPVLHERIDVLPWRLCKGDFSRFNKARKPNNDNRCKENPNDYEYRKQMKSTRNY